MNLTNKLKIKNWLTSPNRSAKEGKQLYSQYGININIIRMMNRINDEKKIISILDTQFKLLLGVSVLPKQIDIKPIKKIKHPIKKKNSRKVEYKAKITKAEHKEMKDPYTEVGSRPEVLIPIYNEKNKIYVQAKNLNSMLIAKGDAMDKYDEKSNDYKKLADERKEMAKKIINLFDQVNKCWKKIDYYAKYNKLPEPELLIEKPKIKADTENPIDLDKRWRTLGTYISKAKKKPERNQEKLKELYSESNEIAKKLNAIYREDKYKMRKYETTSVKRKKRNKNK